MPLVTVNQHCNGMLRVASWMRRLIVEGLARMSVSLRRPNWLTRLREWRAEVRKEIATFGVGAGVFGLLAGLLHRLSTTVGEEYQSLVAIPAVFFTVIAAVSISAFAVRSSTFMVSDFVYFPVEGSYRIVELLLTLLAKLSPQLNRFILSLLRLLKKLLTLTRPILLHMDETRIITSISILLTLCILEFLQEEDRDVFDVIYLVIASGVVAEIINAVVRPIKPKVRNWLARRSR